MTKQEKAALEAWTALAKPPYLPSINDRERDQLRTLLRLAKRATPGARHQVARRHGEGCGAGGGDAGGDDDRVVPILVDRLWFRHTRPGLEGYQGAREEGSRGGAQKACGKVTEPLVHVSLVALSWLRDGQIDESLLGRGGAPCGVLLGALLSGGDWVGLGDVQGSEMMQPAANPTPTCPKCCIAWDRAVEKAGGR